MNRIKLIAIGALALNIWACGGESQPAAETSAAETTNEKVVNDFKGMEKVDLSAYAIDAELYIADASKGKQEFRETEWESLEIEVGKKYGIEIVPFGLSVEEKKEELAGDLVYQVEFIEETPSKIVYKKTIEDNEIEEVHFLINLEINDESYTIKNLNKAYSEKAIQKMIKSAESLTAKKPA